MAKWTKGNNPHTWGKKIKHHASKAVGAVRRHHSSRGGTRGIIGSFMPVVHGGVAQIAASVGNAVVPKWGGIGALAAVGYFTKNETLLTISGMHAAAQLPIGNLLGGIGLGSGGQQATASAVI
jgi:hypothetical protein